MVDQEKIHNQCLSNDPKNRIRALVELNKFFLVIPDKQQAWDDLHRLTNDEESFVRSWAANALGSAFSQVPDKQRAWNDLLRLTNDEDNYVRENAAHALGSTFSQVPNKKQVWNDLIRLTDDESSDVRSSAAYALGSAFSHVPDKKQAWNDLLRLTNDKGRNARSSAAYALGFVFSQVPDKRQAWNNLHRLTNDEDHYVRSSAAYALGSAFSQVPDKILAWNDLHRLTNDEDNSVRSYAACALGSAFSQVPDKQQAWNDLHRLTEDRNVRSSAAYALGYAFSQVPDKTLAWNDLHRLTNDKGRFVRSWAAEALGSAFSQMPDQQQAWNDLRRLTSDEYIFVRFSAAYALGSAFSQVPDKKQAWNDLHRLANDEESYVRSFSNHSLGRVSIFMASQAETDEDYKKELEKAIEFFEIAANEESTENPAQFCLPFYRSFHTIIFKNYEAREEVNKYLEEAKATVEGSKSKELLLKAVENLANALKEVQNLENLDLEAKKGELKFYRQYCDRAAELMIKTEETAPFATATLKRGLPILDRNLKELLEEIQKKAKIACQVSQGTSTQEITCSINKEVQKWEISSQEEMSWCVENLIFTLESTIPRIHKNQNFFDRINQIREEKDIVKQYSIVCTIIPLIPRVSMDEKINNIEQGIDDIKKEVGTVNENTTIIIEKLDEIQEELKNGFKNLDKLSIKVGGIEGECLRIFSEKLLEITKKGESDTLKRFLEEVLKKEDTLTREIESSLAPQKEKEESKGSISKLKSLLKKVKNPTKEFGKDVANEIVVSYTAKGIIEIFLPIMSMAVFGVPIPSQIINILTNVVTEIKN